MADPAAVVLLGGFSLPGDLASLQQTPAAIPTSAWEPAHDAIGRSAPARPSPE